MTDLIEEIRKALKGEKKSEFIDQILKEKALFDALKEAGYSVDSEDAQARAVERPFGVLSKIAKVNLVDLISEVTLIKTIQTLAEISNIKNLESLDLLDRISLIDRITQVDTLTNVANIANVSNLGTLNLVNTINLVKNIDSISSLNTLSTVNTVNSIQTLNLLNTIGQINKINPSDTENVVIDRILNIDHITQVDTISNIDEIKAIHTLGDVRGNLIKNGDFETGDLSFWRSVGDVSVISGNAFNGSYACKIKCAIGTYLYQDIPPIYGDDVCFYLYAKALGGTLTLGLNVIYTDDTSESQSINLTTSWKMLFFEPTQHKLIKYVYIVGSGGDYALVDAVYGAQNKTRVVNLLNPHPITQTNRQNLTVKNEREDLSVKIVDVTVTGQTSGTLVSAISDKRIKVYDWWLWVDADVYLDVFLGYGTYVDDVFIRIFQKGTYGQTYMHPHISNLNRGILYNVSGACTFRGQIHYVQEA